MRAEQLGFDAQSVRPYFEFSRVQEGVLDITSQHVRRAVQAGRRRQDWHPDVEVYDVFDGGKRLGRIYLDMHPRAGKYTHAAQFTSSTGKRGRAAARGRAHVQLPEARRRPALMEQGDVETFFHEFGHLMHHVFAGHSAGLGVAASRTSATSSRRRRSCSRSGCEDARRCRRSRKHYQTNEPIRRSWWRA